jgi:hypothetical protein
MFELLQHLDKQLSRKFCGSTIIVVAVIAVIANSGWGEGEVVKISLELHSCACTELGVAVNGAQKGMLEARLGDNCST